MHATAPQRAVAAVPSTVTSSAVDAGGSVDGEGGSGIGGAGGGAGSKASAAAGDASAPKDAGDPKTGAAGGDS